MLKKEKKTNIWLWDLSNQFATSLFTFSLMTIIPSIFNQLKAELIAWLKIVLIVNNGFKLTHKMLVLFSNSLYNWKILKLIHGNLMMKIVTKHATKLKQLLKIHNNLNLKLLPNQLSMLNYFKNLCLKPSNSWH